MAKPKLPRQTEVCIIGSGPAGLAAARTLEQHGVGFSVLEASSRPGGLILASGNGRCNFTNTGAAPESYNAPDFVRSVVSDHAGREATALMESLGVLPRVIDDRVYPRTLSSRTVLDALIRGIGNRIHADADVTDLEPLASGFRIHTTEGDISCNAVIVCPGSASYGLLERTGHTVEPLEPRLCPLRCEGHDLPRLKMWDGVRTDAHVSVVSRGSTIWNGTGEVLFRPYGLSGIVIFEASRFATIGDEIVCDAIPELDEMAVQGILESRVRDGWNREDLLTGIVHPKLAAGLLEHVGSTIEGLPALLARKLTSLRYTITGFETSTKPQVMRGGVALGEVDPESLESKLMPGLHFAGEVLDVDGACGGFNITWALLSGRRAAVSIARRVR